MNTSLSNDPLGNLAEQNETASDTPTASSLSHIHKFETPTSEKVLLHRYESEDGVPKAIDVVGYDILRQLKCKCGVVETLSLERTKI